MSLDKVEPMETDKYSGNKEIFDQLSHFLPKDDELLFHSLKFFVQDCVEIGDCEDVHSLLGVIDETTTCRNIPESGKYYYLYSMFMMINKHMEKDYLVNALGVLSDYSEAGATCPHSPIHSFKPFVPSVANYSPPHTLGSGTRAPPSSQSSVPPAPSHQPTVPVTSRQPTVPAVHPAKVAPSTPISDRFLIEIADALPSGQLEKFAVSGIGMSLVDFENQTDGMRRHPNRARAVLKWWGQHSGGSNSKIPAFTKQGLSEALQRAELNGVRQDLNLV